MMLTPLMPLFCSSLLLRTDLSNPIKSYQGKLPGCRPKLRQLCRDGHEVRLLGENERHFIGQML